MPAIHFIADMWLPAPTVLFSWQGILRLSSQTGSKKYLLYLAASVPPAIIGFARVKSLDHFPSDFAVGFGLGAVIGIVIPELHKNRHFKDFSLGMFTSPDGMGVSVGWNLTNNHLSTLSK